MSDVIELHAVSVDVDEDLVSRLEDLVDAARAGELVSFCGFGLISDGGVLTTFGPSDDIWREIAALERLKHRLISDID